jgi:DNA (cytosine-5)-methyltransferase 1
VTIGSLFSGIGGLELGLERAGFGPVLWQVEKEPYCRAVLARHWPDAEQFDDVRTVGKYNLRRASIGCGGFPCQDVSQAARGRNDGLDGEQSGLWSEFKRIIDELRFDAVVVENVYSGKNRWLPTVRRDLHVLGYDSVALEVSAADVGANHLRRRIFVVAYAYVHREPVVTLDGEVARLPSHAGAMWNGWSSEPQPLRMDDGIPRGMDRVVALGNAVVPQCAELVGRFIKETCTWL